VDSRGQKTGTDKFPSPILAPDFEVRTVLNFGGKIKISKFGGKIKFKIWQEIKNFKIWQEIQISKSGRKFQFQNLAGN